MGLNSILNFQGLKDALVLFFLVIIYIPRKLIVKLLNLLIPKKNIGLEFEEFIIDIINKLYSPPSSLRKFDSLESFQLDEYKADFSLFNFVLDEKEWIPGKINLDVGCGLGAKVVKVAEKGAKKVYGLDVDFQNLHAAQKFAHRKNVTSKCHFLCCSAEKIPLKDECIDNAFSYVVFEHLRDPVRVLHEVYRLLRKNGHFIIVFNFYRDRHGAHLWHFIHFPWPQLFFSEGALVDYWSKKLALYQKRGQMNFFPKGYRLSESDSDHYFSLNKINTREFEKITRRSSFKLIKAYPYSREKIGKIFPSLLKIPILSEYLKGSYVYLLKK